MTQRRWSAVTLGFLLAVWTATIAYRTNLVIPMPQILPPLPVTQCSNLIPGDLQVERWVPRICYVSEPR
jgi:hypothetical protein